MPATTSNQPSPACPVCGYDQSGLVASWTDACPLAGACSECGAAIEWREVFRPELYEQKRYAEHPEASVPRDLIRTAVWTLTPNRLWRWVPRSQPLTTGRLALAGGTGLAFTTLLVPLLVLVISLGAIYPAYSPGHPQLPVGRAVMVAQSSNMHPLRYLVDHFRYGVSLSGTMSPVVLGFHACGVVVASLWALLARHRGVQFRHILRFAVLTTVPLSLVVDADLGFACVQGVYWYDPNGMFAWMDPLLGRAPLALLAALIFAAIWLGRAWVLFLSLYLRAGRPLLTALAYGVITLLLFPAVMFIVSELRG